MTTNQSPPARPDEDALLSEHEFTNELGNRIYVALRESSDDFVTIIIQTIRAKSDSSSENTVTRHEAFELAKVVLKGLGCATSQPTSDAAAACSAVSKILCGEEACTDAGNWRCPQNIEIADEMIVEIVDAVFSLATSPARDAAEGLNGDIEYLKNVGENGYGNMIAGDAYKKGFAAGKTSAPPKPAPDAVRTLEALLPFIRAGDASKGEPSFYFAEGAATAISAPVPPADGAPDATAWMPWRKGGFAHAIFMNEPAASIKESLAETGGWQIVPVEIRRATPSATGAAEPVEVPKPLSAICTLNGRSANTDKVVDLFRHAAKLTPREQWYLAETIANCIGQTLVDDPEPDVVATPPVRGDREYINTVHKIIRDHLPTSSEIADARMYDAAKAIASLPAQPGEGERT